MISCDEMEQNTQRTFPEVRNKSDPRIKADSTDAIRVGLCDLNWNKIKFCITIRRGNKNQQGEFKNKWEGSLSSLSHLMLLPKHLCLDVS